MGLQGSLDQFNAVSKRIRDVHLRVSRRSLALDHLDVCCTKLPNQRTEILNHERRMRLSRRLEIRINSEMNLQWAALEPGAAALCLLGRFRNFRNFQHAGIEATSRIFLSSRHGELNVVYPFNPHDSNCHTLTYALQVER